MELNIISLGLGVQSSALYFMSSMGELPRADFAIVADPGREKTATYQYLKYLQSWQIKNQGIPIIIRSEKNLYRDLLEGMNSPGQRFASIPAFTHNDDGSQGMLRRQCTSEYKIQVVDNAIRSLYGLSSGQQRPVTKVWKGITLDELDRMSQPDKKTAWKVYVYPFTGFEFDRKEWRKIEWAKQMSRSDVIGWYYSKGLRLPVKSSCVFCPYQSDASWGRMKRESPEDFSDAVKVDYAIRNSTMKGVHNPCYLHRSLQPLDEVVFDEQNDLWGGERSGNCHI